MSSEPWILTFRWVRVSSKQGNDDLAIDVSSNQKAKAEQTTWHTKAGELHRKAISAASVESAPLLSARYKCRNIQERSWTLMNVTLVEECPPTDTRQVSIFSELKAALHQALGQGRQSSETDWTYTWEADPTATEVKIVWLYDPEEPQWQSSTTPTATKTSLTCTVVRLQQVMWTPETVDKGDRQQANQRDLTLAMAPPESESTGTNTMPRQFDQDGSGHLHQNHTKALRGGDGKWAGEAGGSGRATEVADTSSRSPQRGSQQELFSGAYKQELETRLTTQLTQAETRLDNKLNQKMSELNGRIAAVDGLKQGLTELKGRQESWERWRTQDSRSIEDHGKRLIVLEGSVDSHKASPILSRAELLQALKELLKEELDGSAIRTNPSPAGPAAAFDQLLDALRDSSLANGLEYLKKLKPEGMYPADSAHAGTDTLRGLLLALLRQEEQARPADLDWTAKYPILHELSGEFVKPAAQKQHQAVYSALEALLYSLDIKMSHPRPGDEFDRTYHRSLGREPAPHLDRSQVAMVDRPAFLKGGHTLLLAYVRTG